MSIATGLKIIAGLVFAGAAFLVVTCRRCGFVRRGLVRRGLKRPTGRRPETEEAQALARGAEDAQGTRTVASDQAVLEAQARSLANMN
jgi:hypothetical protein